MRSTFQLPADKGADDSYEYQVLFFFSSPEPKAWDELIGWDLRRRPSVRLCIRPFTLSNINISETSWPIVIKFHLEYHCGGGLAALGFGPDRIRTLVSMATDSSHNMENLVTTLALSFLIVFSLFLQVTRTTIIS